MEKSLLIFVLSLFVSSAFGQVDPSSIVLTSDSTHIKATVADTMILTVATGTANFNGADVAIFRGTIIEYRNSERTVVSDSGTVTGKGLRAWLRENKRWMAGDLESAKRTVSNYRAVIQEIDNKLK